MMFRTVARIVILSVVISCSAGTCVAEPLNAGAELGLAFAQAEKFIDTEKFGDAGEVLSRVRASADTFGFKELPDYSQRILDRVPLLADAGRITESAYLINQAVKLSPSDPATLFRASSFERIVGHGAAMSYFFDGLRHSVSRPSLVMSLARNLIITLLVSGTLGLLLVSVIQLVCNVKRVIINATKKASIYSRGLLGPLFVLLFMVLPLAGGLLVAIGCWCLVLSRFVKECRSLALFAGILVLGWALAIPTLQALTIQLFSPMTQAVERTRFDAFSPLDIELLSKEVSLHENDPLIRFALGMALFRSGDVEGAEQQWRSVSEITEVSGSREVAAAALLNRGIVHFQQGDIAVAKQLFDRSEEVGGKRFESAYNLARIALVQVDTVKHDEEFEAARARDARRLAEIESASSVEDQSLLSVQPSWSVYALRLLTPISTLRGQPGADSEITRQMLMSNLVRGAESIKSLFGLGLFVLLGAFWSRMKGTRDFYRYREGALDHSLIWVIVPAGPFIVGQRPGLGLFLVTSVIALCIAALGEPSIFVWNLPESLPLEMYLFVAAGVIAVGSSVWAVVGADARAAHA